MNRAERRRLQKKGITAKELKVIEDNSALKAIDFAVKGMIASFVIVLHDKWGWGNVRIKRLLKQVDDVFDSINKNYVSIEDLQKAILDEIGIDVK
ncbi:MAG TPA: hypothetical protein PKV92_09190 [Thermodesulfovibrio thiophilus]|nr:hypothetical protein [Thermodesulfovibrio thiophilus]